MTTNKNPIFLSIALLLLLCVQGSAWAGGPANNVNIDETSPAAKAIVANPGSMDEFLIERLGSAPLPSWGKTFTLGFNVVRSYLFKHSGTIEELRKYTDVSAPSFFFGVSEQKVYIPRKTDITIPGYPADTPITDLSPKSQRFIKAEWVIPKTLRSSSSSCIHGGSGCLGAFETKTPTSLKTKTKPTGPVALHLHGGGYFICTRKTHRIITSQVAKALNMRVLVPDYRRAPEHPFPYPLYDAISSYLSLIDAGYDASSQIYLVGDSAGGGMVMALLLWLKEHPQLAAMPAGVVVLSPFVDLAVSTPSFILNRPFDYITGLTGDETTLRDPKWLGANRTHYYCKNNELKNHYVSPILADYFSNPSSSLTPTIMPPSQNDDLYIQQVSNTTATTSAPALPPILIQVGGMEMLRDESIILFNSTLSKHTDIQLEIYLDQPHVVHVFHNIHPIAKQAFRNMGEFVRRVVRERSSTSSSSSSGPAAVRTVAATSSMMSNIKRRMAFEISPTGERVLVEEPMQIVEQASRLLEELKSTGRLDHIEKILPVFD